MNVLPAGDHPLLSTVYPFLERFFPELAVFPELLMHSVRTAKYAFRLSCFLGLGRPRLLRSPLSSGEALKVMAEIGGKRLDPHLFQKARAFLARFKEEAV